MVACPRRRGQEPFGDDDDERCTARPGCAWKRGAPRRGQRGRGRRCRRDKCRCASDPGPRLRPAAGRRRAARGRLLLAGDQRRHLDRHGHQVLQARLAERAGALRVGGRDPHGAGTTPAQAGDFDFSYPAGTFQSEASIATFGAQLEATVLGAYLGAIAGLQTDSFKGGLASIAACEAQHGSFLSTLTGGKAFNLSFPPPLTIEDASDAFDSYIS